MAGKSRWKDRERVVARALGTERIANNGTGQHDIFCQLWGIAFSIEHKSKESLPAWLTDAMAQAVRNSPADHVPIVALSAGAGPGKPNHRYLVVRLSDVEALAGNQKNAGNPHPPTAPGIHRAGTSERKTP
jgi:hypothetical protein